MTKELSQSETDFWNRARAFAKDEPERSVRIAGKHYAIWPETDTGARGFGGRQFTIQFSDGRVVRTTNLWHQGEIPEQFRAFLPDNARFVRDEE